MKNVLKWVFILTIASFADSNVCYEINDYSARAACLGKAYATDDRDARNIIRGDCYALSNWAKNNGLREVCDRGEDGCYFLRDSDAISSCASCGGSNKWARLYAVGYTLRCYKVPRKSNNAYRGISSSRSSNLNLKATIKGLDVNGDGFLSLRKRPKGKEIGRLYNGDKVIVMQQDGLWYKVKDIRSGKIGWSHGKWIYVSRKTTRSRNGKVAGLDPHGDGFLSLRTKPKGKEIGRLYNGDRVKIFDKNGKWYKVRDVKSGKVGWTHSNWIKAF